MKNALIPVGVFTLALLAVTTWSVIKTPLPPIPVDEIALADSLLADSLWRDSLSTQHDASPNGDAVVTLAEDVATRGAVATRQGLPEQVPVVADGEAVLDPTSGPTGAAYQSLARIFAKMKPAEAAEVLLLMSNEEVEGVVRNLGVRQAASVMSSLPEQRAAELARRLLIPSPEGER